MNFGGMESNQSIHIYIRTHVYKYDQHNRVIARHLVER